jgi:hypothetical protein
MTRNETLKMVTDAYQQLFDFPLSTAERYPVSNALRDLHGELASDATPFVPYRSAHALRPVLVELEAQLELRPLYSLLNRIWLLYQDLPEGFCWTWQPEETAPGGQGARRPASARPGPAVRARFRTSLAQILILSTPEHSAPAVAGRFMADAARSLFVGNWYLVVVNGADLGSLRANAEAWARPYQFTWRDRTQYLIPVDLSDSAVQEMLRQQSELNGALLIYAPRLMYLPQIRDALSRIEYPEGLDHGPDSDISYVRIVAHTLGADPPDAAAAALLSVAPVAACALPETRDRVFFYSRERITLSS